MVPGGYFWRAVQSSGTCRLVVPWGPHRFYRHEDYLDHSAAAAAGIMMGFLSFTGGAKALKEKRPCQASRTHPSSQ